MRGRNGFWILFIVYVIMFLLDLGSTLANGELVKYLEANPLYKFGGLFLPILANLILMACMYFFYKNSTNPTTKYMLLFTMVAVITTRIILVYNNFHIAAAYHDNPEVMLEAAKVVTSEQKVQAIKSLYALNLLPFFNGIVAFLFFKYDHDIKNKE